MSTSIDRKMNRFALFTDVSLDPLHRRGVGAFLFVPVSFLGAPFNSKTRDDVSRRLKKRRFENTSSTRLEVQTLIWALDEINKIVIKESRITLQVYTDSQCVSGLPERRSKLISRRFLSQKTGRPLKNADLYRTFYAYQDRFGFTLTKVAGHTRVLSRDTVSGVFACVDQEVRKALKGWCKVGGEASTLKQTSF
jgi:ribonuclease HI